MAWFDDVFMPSLFAKVGAGKTMWLSQRQTAVCVKNMDMHETKNDGYQGHSATHYWFSTTWDGRDVRVNYSKLNGCSTIEFGLNADERKMNEAKSAEEKRSDNEADRIRFSKMKEKHPERWSMLVESAKRNYEHAVKILEAEESDLADGSEFSSKELVENAKKRVAKCKDRLEALGI